MTSREVRQRFHGTSLGYAWPVLEPLAKLLVFTLIFPVLGIRFGARDDLGWYAVNLFLGIVVFGIFSEVILKAPTLVLNRRNLVKRVVFPLEILSVATMGAALFYAACGFAIAIAGAALLPSATVSWATLPLIPIILLPLILLCLGLGWWLSSLGVFLRDIHHINAVLVSNLLFFLTPVIYPLSIFDDRPAIRAILLLNPLTTIVESVRIVILRSPASGEQVGLDWLALGIITGVSIAVFLGGYGWFMKSRRGFSDVI